MPSERLEIKLEEIEPLRCLGKGRCIWYDMIGRNTDKSGFCGYDFYLEDPTFLIHGYFIIKKSSKIEKVRPGKTICQHRFGLTNYSEPELI
jgi:hypothetical protein